MNWPLMTNNITDEDANILIEFLSKRPLPILTNHNKVREFEKEWSKWLGVKYSVFVNSGSSANIITLAILKELLNEKPYNKKNEVIVSPLNWVSDISSILHAGLKPIFSDINIETLSLDESHVYSKICENTCAVLLTHILGYNGLNNRLLDMCKDNNLFLIEDCCESHGATFNGQKIGSFGNVSNFSFYYAHHATTIEGGMICTNDEKIYEMARIFRSHGMAREAESNELKTNIINSNLDLNKDFIFLYNAYNMRSTELNAVLGLNQLKRLNENNIKRAKNLEIFLDNLDKSVYYTNFKLSGNSNYAFTLLLNPNFTMRRDDVETLLTNNKIEFRRGMSGGGNQLRQPYLSKLFGKEHAKSFNACEYIHSYGWYIGNYPDLEKEKILWLTDLLNSI
jgi:CDP-6-deoxy-D-xylo-4-hexulose-3-dehydrase